MQNNFFSLILAMQFAIHWTDTSNRFEIFEDIYIDLICSKPDYILPYFWVACTYFIPFIYCSKCHNLLFLALTGHGKSFVLIFS